MKVYHGGVAEIFNIDLSKSQSNKDFGRGFYVTKFRNHAQSWALGVSRRHGGKPVVTEFEFFERAFDEARYKPWHEIYEMLKNESENNAF